MTSSQFSSAILPPGISTRQEVHLAFALSGKQTRATHAHPFLRCAPWGSVRCVGLLPREDLDGCMHCKVSGAGSLEHFRNHMPGKSVFTVFCEVKVPFMKLSPLGSHPQVPVSGPRVFAGAPSRHTAPVRPREPRAHEARPAARGPHDAHPALAVPAFPADVRGGSPRRPRERCLPRPPPTGTGAPPHLPPAVRRARGALPGTHMWFLCLT